MKRTLIASAICFLAGLALWPLGRAATAGPRLRGTVTVFAAVDAAAGCDSIKGFDDITSGATVQAADKAGNVVATSTLKAGRRLDGRQGCTFEFSLGNLHDADPVVLSVGNRQGLTLTGAQLRDIDYRVDVRLGAA